MSTRDGRRVVTTPADEAAAAAAQVCVLVVTKRRESVCLVCVSTNTQPLLSTSLPLSPQALAPVLNFLEPDPPFGPLGVRWPFWDGAGAMSLPPLPPGADPPPARTEVDAFVQAHADGLTSFNAWRRGGGTHAAALAAALPSARPEPGDGLCRAVAAIPAPFFDASFTLTDPAVWDAMCAAPGDPGARADATETLASLAALADSALTEEVAARAPRFVASAAVLADLRGAVGGAEGQAVGARALAERAAVAAATATAAATRLGRRRANLQAVLEVATSLAQIVVARDAAGELLSAGDWSGALGPLVSLRSALTAATPLPPALDALSTDVARMEVDVGRLLRGQAARALGVSGATAAPPDAAAVQAVLAGAVAADCVAAVLEAASSAARASAAAALPAAVAAALPAALPPGVDSANMGLADGVAAVDEAGFNTLLAAATAAAVDRVAAAAAARAALVAAATDAAPGATAAVPAGGDAMVAASLAGAAGRWADLVAARGPALSRGRLSGVLALRPHADDLATAAARHGAKPPRDPGDAVAAAGRGFLEGWAARAAAEVDASVDADDWGGGPHPPAVQTSLSALEAAAAAGEAGRAAELLLPVTSGGGDATTQPSLTLSLTGATYVASSSTATLIQALVTGAAAGVALPGLAAPAATRCAALAARWNARSAAAVLGARALSTVPGLKALSARRLAVAARSVAAVAAVTGPLASVLASADPRGVAGVSAAGLVSLRSDLAAHRAQLHAKLVAVVRERVGAGLAVVAADPGTWAGGGADDGGARPPSRVAVDAARHVTALADAVAPTLAPSDAGSVLVRAAAGVASAAADALAAAATAGAGPRAQAVADGACLLAALRALPLSEAELDGALDPLESLFRPPKRRARVVVQERPAVVDTPQPLPPPAVEVPPPAPAAADVPPAPPSPPPPAVDVPPAPTE